MTNEEVMQTMTNMGLHEGGMDNWVADNAWVKFAALVASAEREACAQIVEVEAMQYAEPVWAIEIVNDIRARGQA